MSFESLLIHECTIIHKTVDQELRYDAKTENFLIADIITGQLSGATGVLENIVGDSNGVMVLNGVQGTFRDNETVTGSSQGSAAANGTNYDHMDEYGQLELTKSNINVNCRFYAPQTGQDGIINKATGDVFRTLPKVTLPASVNPVVAERITGLSEGFELTYTITNTVAAYDRKGLHHWTCELAEVEP